MPGAWLWMSGPECSVYSTGPGSWIRLASYMPSDGAGLSVGSAAANM